MFNLVRNSVVHSPCCERERIHLLRLLILNEYAARYAVTHHYLSLVDVDDWAVLTADSV